MRLTELQVSALSGEPRLIDGEASQLREVSELLTTRFHIHLARLPSEMMSDKIVEKEGSTAAPSYDAAAVQHGALPTRTGSVERRGTLQRGPFFLDIPVLNQLRGKRCILASQSPRRKQILAPVAPSVCRI
jgi:hypothetical protein